MKNLQRITLNPAVMGGKPCIRGMSITVGTIIALLAAENSTEEIYRHTRIWKRMILKKLLNMRHGDHPNMKLSFIQHETSL